VFIAFKNLGFINLGDTNIVLLVFITFRKLGLTNCVSLIECVNKL